MLKDRKIRKFLYLVLCAGVVMSCQVEEKLIVDNGHTYRINSRKCMGVTTKSVKTKVDISTEDFNRLLERQKAEAEQKMDLQRQQYAADLAQKKKEMDMRDEMVCKYILGACLVLAALCAVCCYIFKANAGWWGGLSLVFCGVAFGAAIMGDILTWLHSAWFVPAISGVAFTFWLAREVSIVEYVKKRFLNKALDEPVKEEEPPDAIS